jgi:hypothetical protein
MSVEGNSAASAAPAGAINSDHYLPTGCSDRVAALKGPDISNQTDGSS